MKHLIVFSTAILICISTTGQINWAPEGAVWYYNFYQGGHSEPQSVGYLTISSIGDSTVIDTTFKKLSLTRYYPDGIVENEGFIFTFEKDSIVYLWKDNRATEIYDFTKSVGDIQVVAGFGVNNCGNSESGTIVVDSTGTESISGIECLFYYSSPTDTSIWELPGKTNSIYGNQWFMFGSPVYCGISGDINYAGPLRCYYDNSIGLVKLGQYPCDTIITTNVAIIESQNAVCIYPNPTGEILYISHSLLINPDEPLQVFIFDLEGKCHLNRQMLENEVELDLSSLSNGPYSLSLSTSTRIIHSQMIIKIK